MRVEMPGNTMLIDCIPLLSLLRGHHNQCIHVRASRLWHHRGGLETGEVKDIRMVLVDEQGDSIYAIVTGDLVDRYIGLLHEMAVYELALFQVSDRPQIMRPVENPMVILFTQLTIVQPVLNPPEMFPEWTYNLTSFAELPAPHDTPPRLVDVIGVIRSISYVSAHETPTRNIPIARRCVVLADESGSEIKINLWGEPAYRFNGRVIDYLGQDESAVVVFVGMTVHSHEGVTELAGSGPCRWYINVDIPEISILRVGFLPLFKPIVQLPAPPPITLRTQVNGHYPLRPLSTLLNHDFFQNEDAMFRCVVQIWRFTPGQPWWRVSCSWCRRESRPSASSSGEPTGFTCSDIECGCTDANMEYRLSLLGSDVTGEAEFTMTGRVARNFIGVSVARVVLNNYQGNMPITNLAVAASQIQHTPPELAAVLNASYRFFLYVGHNNFQRNWTTFNVLAVEARY